MWLIFKFFHLAWIEIASNFSLQSLVPSWDQKLESLSWCHQISGMQETNLWPKYEALQNCYEDKQEIKMIFSKIIQSNRFTSFSFGGPISSCLAIQALEREVMLLY